MKRLIFFVVMLSMLFSSAQGQYSYGYGYGYSYGYGYPSNYPQAPAYQYPSYYYGGQQQTDYPFQKSQPDTEKFKNSPIEIWLGKGVGRWGDYWFRALGGTSKKPTPTGTYTVKVKHEDFYSYKYDAPMPRSVFFTEQCAIHVGSLKVRSHGCIHVDWEAGQLLYDYAKVGKTKVRVYQ